MIVSLAVAGVLVFFLGSAAYTADRFLHHSATVDATILETVKLGCFGASGNGTGMGSGTTVWRVSYPHPGGRHETQVSRPCTVIPPDYGRGRGAVWIQYDAENLDQLTEPGSAAGDRSRTGGC